MRRKTTRIMVTALILSTALLVTSCGQRKSTSRLTVQARRETSSSGAQGSVSQRISGSNQSSGIDRKSIEEKAVSLGLSTPTRPEKNPISPMKPVRLGNHKNIDNSTLPRVEITLPDDYQLGKDDYTTATISITNSGDNNLPASSGKVRIRGNSTAEPAKKSLKIRFDSKQSVFGREPEKTWTLLANCFDVTSIHNYVCYNLWDHLTPEGTFSSLCEFVDVYVNGNYQGVYNLCDQIETGKGRVPVKGNIGESPEQTEYLIEEDFRAPRENPDEEGLNWFWLSWSNHPYKVKSPETKDGLTKAHTEYIRDYMDEVFISLRLNDWERIQQLMDVNSFIIGQAIAEISKNSDITQASMIMYKTADGKLTFGPAWDFDTTFGTCSEEKYGAPEGFSTENSIIFGGLMGIPEYKAKYTEYFNSHLNDMIAFMNDTIDKASSSFGANLENEYKIWGHYSQHFGVEEMKKLTSHAEQIAFMKKWITARAAWLHEAYSK